MPRHVSLVAVGLAIASAALGGQASGQSPATERLAAPSGHRAAKAKPHQTNPFMSSSGASSGVMQTDDWFSFGPPKEAEIEKEAPGVKIKVHDPQEDDIIVYGARQKRDFEDVVRSPNLTSPQALEAAQPTFVPNMGDSCSYKSGCFDMSQTPLLSAGASLLGGD